MKFQMGTVLRPVIGHYPGCPVTRRMLAKKGNRCPKCGAVVERVETDPVNPKYVAGGRDSHVAPAQANLYGRLPFDPDRDPKPRPKSKLESW